MISPRRHSRRNAPAGRHMNAAGGVEVPTLRSHARVDPLTFAEARDGEQVQFPDIAPEAVDGGVHIKPASLVRALFADTIIPPEVVEALPTLPDDSYPQGSLVFLTTDAKLYRNTDGSTWSRAVDGADIIADSITAGSIAAGAIGAAELAATLVLASTIKTAESGARLELDDDGMRSYNASEDLEVQIPTDGSAVYVKGQIQATELLVLGDAEIRGDGNVLAKGSVTVLEAQQAAPQQGPQLFGAHDTTVTQIVPDEDVDLSASTWQRTGLDYSASGGVGGATKVFYTSSIDNLGIFYLVEMLTADMTVNRFAQIDESDLFFAVVQNVCGVARHGSFIYVLMKVHFDLSDQFWVARYAASDLSFDAVYTSASFPNASPRTPVIASNGTNIYIADKASGTGTIKWNLYNATMVKQGSTIDTSYNSDSNDHLRDMAVGQFDFGATRIALFCELDNEIELFDSTGARQANEVFPGNGGTTTDEGGLTYGDADGTGARFWSMSGTQMGAVTRHTNWVWTTASSIYWAAYSWYDSAGTTHETTVSPLTSFTHGRRKLLGVTMASLPGSGGADEPDNHRLYIFPNATEPATTSLDLQITTSADSVYLSDYNSAGAAPPVANDFPAGTPAELKSVGGEWSLLGDGTAEFTDLTVDTLDVTSIVLGADVTITREAAGILALGASHGIRIRASVDATLASNDHPLTIGNDGGNNVAFDNNEIQARDNGAGSSLSLNRDGGDVNMHNGGSVFNADGSADLAGGAFSIASNGAMTVAGGSWTASGVLHIAGSGPGYIELEERSLPVNADANQLRIFADDNGSGKTRLRVRFATGAAVTLATEP